MARESLASKRERAAAIEERMFEHYGPGKASLDYRTPFELTVAVVLSAQCTDAAVNKVTPRLFAAFPTRRPWRPPRPTKWRRSSTRWGSSGARRRTSWQLAQMVTAVSAARCPPTWSAAKAARRGPGKTANCVMCEAFKDPQGIAVDTHVFRIAHRLKLAGPSADTPQKVEDILLKVYPREQWLFINHQWVHFGREFCRARSPRCADCIVGDLCPTRGLWG